MDFDCGSLKHEYQRAICRGETNHPSAIREKYLQRWIAGASEAKPTTGDSNSAVWDVSMPSRGVGDTIAKITHATGIERMVNSVTGGGCGCRKRHKWLNGAFPYKSAEDGRPALGQVR